ncbi:transcriptional regulator, Cro/CI family [Geomicrobium sp. JCM 19037]|uniref:helix-turn-helix transcriptional regulator n=1 Tax=unclassified Geomicrobium TaxID=2628951 RepID=UPI00045F460D|nr:MULTISPECIES: helix-turn-helix transcriptional regulator [unclassified Geomicrobium]GAK04006.1 transcriptional regulator, Cro/CI family [Geomicrobium sp. JCM 19037]GAK13517.1 transcriptional regulator, Cro/CI family [Geomicrobium sp. JCM 19039]
MKIRNRVKELRARDQFTQGDLAQAVGVTRQTIVALEKDNYTPSLILAMRIAEVFELPVEQIFTLEKEEETT